MDLAAGTPQRVAAEDVPPEPKPADQKIPVLNFSGQSPAKKQYADKFDEEEPVKPELDSEDSGSYERS